MKKRIIPFVIFNAFFSLASFAQGSLPTVGDETENNGSSGSSVSIEPGVPPEIYLTSRPSQVTPNVASLGVFGNIPVSLYTGTPNISIPIYILRDGDISVPISISYHSSNRRVNSMPSWVGLGWGLTAGGYISRSVKGLVDEDNSKFNAGLPLDLDDKKEYTLGYLYNHDIWGKESYGALRGNYFDNHHFECNRANQRLTGNEIRLMDSEPDEFSFNFNGYSGKFYFNAGENDIAIKSDYDVQIIFDIEEDIVDFYTIDSLLSADYEDIRTFNGRGGLTAYIIRFKILTPDGFLYEFGGLDAVEFSVPISKLCDKSSYGDGRYMASTTWHLTKITSPNGNVVSFHYDRPPDCICDLKTACSSVDINLSTIELCGEKGVRLKAAETLLDNINGTRVSGHILMPVYLASIHSNITTISFERSLSTYLTYPSVHLPHEVNTNSWQKLDNIHITHRDKTDPITFAFAYNSNMSERMKLASLTEKSKTTKKGSYYFTYNTNLLPAFLTETYDHWGYYKSETGQISPDEIYFDRRKPSNLPEYYLAEVLEKVSYPTGGYSLFEYEPNTYGKYVNRLENDLVSVNNNEIGGGIRIKRITSTEKDPLNPPIIKQYYYAGNYMEHKNPNALSSGILSGKQKYLWENANQNDKIMPKSFFDSDGHLPLGESAFGSPVGYSEVTEVQMDGQGNVNGYTVHEFTNFSKDYGFNETYWDRGLSVGQNPYSPPSKDAYLITGDRSHQRGKPKVKTVYNKNSQIVEKEEIEYLNYIFGARTGFSSNGKMISFNSSSRYPALNIHSYDVSTGGTSIYLDSHLPCKKTKTTFPNPSKPLDSMVFVTTYEYNRSKTVRKEITTNSHRDTVSVEYLFPEDFSMYGYTGFGYAVTEMRKDGANPMYARPIASIKRKGNTIVDAAIQTYQYYNDYTIIRPYQQLKLKVPQNELRIEMVNGDLIFPDGYVTETYLAYDAKGKLTQAVGSDGVSTVYVWGYVAAGLGNQHLLFEIYNASLQEVEDILGTPMIPLTPPVLRVFQEQMLRDNLPNALITSYEHNPGFGISSITNPQGLKTTYHYDDLGRLIEVRDFEGNILKKHNYIYRGILNYSTGQ